MHKALLPAALVVLLGLIVDARPLSAQSVYAQPPAGAAPAPMTAPSGIVRARMANPRMANPRTAMPAAHPGIPMHRRHVLNKRRIAERNGYKRVSDLVNFPKFFPGLGIVFVKPETLPLGPFLCFDRDDRLVATVYMVSIKDIDDHKSFEAPAFTGKVDHISYYFNGGHPGMDMPHYHIVIWHVSKDDEARVAH